MRHFSIRIQDVQAEDSSICVHVWYASWPGSRHGKRAREREEREQCDACTHHARAPAASRLQSWPPALGLLAPLMWRLSTNAPFSLFLPFTLMAWFVRGIARRRSLCSQYRV